MGRTLPVTLSVMLSITLSVVILLLVILPISAKAEGVAGDVEDGVEDVDATTELLAVLVPWSNVRAEFVQEIFDSEGTSLQTQRGRFGVRSGGQFYWTTSPPFEQYIVSDGQEVRLYDPDLEQMTIRRLEPGRQSVALTLFSGHAAEWLAHYRVSHLPESTASLRRFRLVPRDAADLFAELTIDFRNGKPDQLDLHDNLGQLIRIHLENPTTMSASSSDYFNLDVPDHIEIIDER